MFANPTNVGISQRVVATLVACAVALLSIGVYTTAQAANLVSVSNTLTDSDLSVTSAHTIAFTIPTGSSLTNGNTVTITFPTGFTGVNNIASGDVTVTVAGTPDPFASFAQSGQNISFNSVAATAGQQVVVAITTGNVTNPATAGSYEFVVSTGTDTGRTRVAIIDNVLVTAIVNTAFDFTITGLATSTAINGTSTTGSTSPTLIAFGKLTANQVKTLAQQLAVTTNARNGFVVTVGTDGDLQSSNGAIIDTFANGTDISTPTNWSAPTNNISDAKTWGHWGLTSNDANLASAFGANQFIAASTTPRTVFTHNGPADGVTQNIGQAEVGYQIRISPLQEAADDYNTTLTYIATPTF
jgi:hypothetical protein